MRRWPRGYRLEFPDGSLTFSANPLKGKGHLSKPGLEWFAKLTFVADLPQKLETFDQVIEEIDRSCVERHKNSELLKKRWRRCLTSSGKSKA
jgi:hypothetical protein